MNVICHDYGKKCLNFTFYYLFTAVHLWAQVVTCLYCIQEVLSSNLDRMPAIVIKGVWLSTVPSGRCWNSTLD